MTGLQERLRQRFDMLDVDRNGQLEKEDFEALAERVITAVGAKPNSPKAEAARKAHLTYWEGLRKHADTDGNGVVDFDEYRAVVHDEQSFEAYVRPYVEAITKLVDTDNDGTIDRQEYLKYMTAVGFPTKGASDMFAKLDPRGKGDIPVNEWADAIKSYYLSESKGTADLLLGVG